MLRQLARGLCMCDDGRIRPYRSIGTHDQQPKQHKKNRTNFERHTGYIGFTAFPAVNLNHNHPSNGQPLRILSLSLSPDERRQEYKWESLRRMMSSAPSYPFDGPSKPYILATHFERTTPTFHLTRRIQKVLPLLLLLTL